MPADVKSGPGARPGNLQGSVFVFQSEQERVEAIDKAFDYRGDVTLQVAGQPVEGYIFNRDAAARPPRLELFVKDGTEPLIIPYADVESIAFTGRDTADGKSWDAWVNKKAEQRQAEAERLAAEAAERGHL